MATEHFLHLPVDFPKVFLLGHEVFLGKFHHNPNQGGRHWEDNQCNQRHYRADAQHHYQDAHQRRHRGNQLGHALVQPLPQSIHIIGNPGEHLPHCPGLKIFHGHPVNFAGNVCPEPETYFLCNPSHKKALDKGAGSADEVDAD